MSVLEMICLERCSNSRHSEVRFWKFEFHLNFYFLQTNISNSHLVFFSNKRRPVYFCKYVPREKINDGMFKSSKNISILHTF